MRWIGRSLVLLLLVVMGLWTFGPREPAVIDVHFDPDVIGDDPDAYLAAREAGVDGIRPGMQKQIVWADAGKGRAGLAVVYLHGFSATLQEIRPVPDQVAENLGAHLIFTRFKGHGRDGPAMAEASVEGWMTDVAEALAIARRIADKTLVIGTSTGGTLAALATKNPELAAQMDGIVFVSPNFAVNNPAAPLLTMPAGRWLLPLLFGAERSFEPHNAGHAENWTTRYPSAAVFPMAAAVRRANEEDYSGVETPALFMFSDDDQVVKAEATRALADRWGGPVVMNPVRVGPEDDPFSHVIAGDILSPGMTDGAVATITAWARDNGLGE